MLAIASAGVATRRRVKKARVFGHQRRFCNATNLEGFDRKLTWIGDHLPERNRDPTFSNVAESGPA
jgi:hypothetical protein